jgi:hypothetical protein
VGDVGRGAIAEAAYVFGHRDSFQGIDGKPATEHRAAKLVSPSAGAPAQITRRIFNRLALPGHGAFCGASPDAPGKRDRPTVQSETGRASLSPASHPRPRSPRPGQAGFTRSSTARSASYAANRAVSLCVDRSLASAALMTTWRSNSSRGMVSGSRKRTAIDASSSLHRAARNTDLERNRRLEVVSNESC